MCAGVGQTNLFDRAVAGLVPLVPQPLVKRFGRPYVAGESLEDALQTVAALAKDNLLATLDIVGESVSEEIGAAAAADAYVQTLDALRACAPRAHVSLKPSGLGSSLSSRLCWEKIARVVRHAEETGSFVRIDMEEATTVDATLALYKELRRAGLNRVGIVLQARLWRTAQEVETLAEFTPNVRLCKGIYLEPPHVALQDHEAIRLNYARLLRRLLMRGSYVAIATHDEYLIADALDTLQELGIGPDRYEFQMLLGVRHDLARLLARDHAVRLYVPFGVDSFAYAQRRLRENPQIAGHVAKAMLHRLTPLKVGHRQERDWFDRLRTERRSSERQA